MNTTTDRTRIEEELHELRLDLEDLRREWRNSQPDADSYYAEQLDDEYHKITAMIADKEHELASYAQCTVDYCPACWNSLGIKRDHRTSYPTRCPVSGNRPMQ